MTSLVVADAVEQVIDRCAEMLFDHYLDERVVPFAVGCAVESLFDAVERAAVQMDCDTLDQANTQRFGGANSYGEGSAFPSPAPVPEANPFALPPDNDAGMWFCEPEPVPCPIDAAARGAVRNRPVGESNALTGLSQQTSKASLSKQSVPARLSRSVFDRGVEWETHCHDPIADAQLPRATQTVLGEQHEAAVEALHAVRPISPTEADTLFLQRELAIPERPSSVADGSRRPERRDGPEHHLRRQTLARERANRQHIEARQKQQAADAEREREMIRKATGKAHGAKFTMQDDGTILSMARTAGASSRNGRRRGSLEKGVVKPDVSVSDQGAVGADDSTAMLLKQTAAGTKPTFKAPLRVEPAFGGREARRNKRFEELRRTELRSQAAREQEAAALVAIAGRVDEGGDSGVVASGGAFDHPLPLSVAAAAGMEEDGYFKTGIDEQPSIVQSLGRAEVVPGASLREAGLGEVSGGKHPREGGRTWRAGPTKYSAPAAASLGLASPPPGGSGPVHAVGNISPDKGARAHDPEYGAGATGGGNGSTTATARSKVSAHQFPVSPVSIKTVAPSGAGFAAIAAGNAGGGSRFPGEAARSATGSDRADSAAPRTMVRETRGRGGFAASSGGGTAGHREGERAGGSMGDSLSHREGLAALSAMGRSPAGRSGRGPSGHASPAHQRELEAAIGPSMTRYPRDRVSKQARPGPESHQPPPLWPGTSRFDPRGEAGPLGPAGVEAVDDADLFVGSGLAAPTSSPTNSKASPSDGTDARHGVRKPGAEWGETALRRSGGALIVNPAATIDDVATGERAVRLPRVATSTNRQ